MGKPAGRAAHTVRHAAVRARLPGLACDRADADAALGQADGQLQFEPGRVVMTVEAELSEPSGRFGQIEATLPAGLELFEVSGPGLGYWSSTAHGRLRLMFDGSTASPRRRVRLVGSIRCERRPARRSVRVSTEWLFRGSSGRTPSCSRASWWPHRPRSWRCRGDGNDAHFVGIVGRRRD